MMFIGGAVAGAALSVLATGSDVFLTSGAYDLARAEIHKITTIYATKMAGVFMISTSTVAIYTGIAPRWIAILGYVLALILLIGSYYISWSVVVLPIWVFLISIHLLTEKSRKLEPNTPASPG